MNEFFVCEIEIWFLPLRHKDAKLLLGLIRHSLRLGAFVLLWHISNVLNVFIE